MCFRPLIRGFFFYYVRLMFPNIKGNLIVSVPSFGDSFFIYRGWKFYPYRFRVSVPLFGDSFFIVSSVVLPATTFPRFRPLIRGFFFYALMFNGNGGNPSIVSVPSFGDSFFIFVTPYGNISSGNYYWFPSPHSGILFL